MQFQRLPSDGAAVQRSAVSAATQVISWAWVATALAVKKGCSKRR